MTQVKYLVGTELGTLAFLILLNFLFFVHNFNVERYSVSVGVAIGADGDMPNRPPSEKAGDEVIGVTRG